MSFFAAHEMMRINVYGKASGEPAEGDVMICQARHCQDDGEPRYLAKPVGSYSIAGAQPKVSATELPPLCDEHWELVRFNLSQGAPL